MKPTPDDGSSEPEIPMTRALFATELDEEAKGTPVDPDGTIDGDTRPLTSGTDSALEQAAGSGPGWSPGSDPGPGRNPGSAWSGGSDIGGSAGGMSRRGIVGMIEPGQTLYSKYQVLRKLGGGAMGDVWLVRHVTLKSQHALKVIVPNFATNYLALMRFQREFEVMATLRHEHAVTIYDACIDDDGGYIDMEYVEGQTIHDVLGTARGRPDLDPSEPLMPLDWIARVLEQLSEVLQAAHEKGIVHRDLKPSNLMLVGGRKPGKEYLKVLDFGIAKIRDDPEGAAGRDHEENANKTQGFIGTPSYGSPEQALGLEDVDGRADLYSVGIMLYEFITGRLPFRGNHWQVMSLNATAPPPPFVATNLKLRPMPEVERVVLRILSKEPGRRPQAARALFEEFRDAAQDVLHRTLPERTPSSWVAFPSRGLTTPTTGSMLPTGRDDEADAPPPSTHSSTLMARPPATPRKHEDHGESPSDLGAVVDRPPRRPWAGAVAISGMLLVALVAVVGIMALADPKLKFTVDLSPTVPDLGPNPPPKPARFEQHWPAEYLPVGPEGGDKPWPRKVRRTTDEVYFVKIDDGIYLPEGFEPGSPVELVDRWPRVIVHQSGIRFLRIQGSADWVMGAWDAPSAGGRADGPTHPVALSGYYIQETEVTNGQYEDYLKQLLRTRPAEWEQAYLRLMRSVGPDLEIARQHPAIHLSRKHALEFAGSLPGSQLPTEAQWEFAARSRGEKRRYVWGDVPQPSRDLANIDLQDSKTTAPVGSYPKDKTAQGVLDMTGNVQEMCRDGWLPAYTKSDIPALDPCASPVDPEKPTYSIRGAAYDSLTEDCATTRRDDRCSATEAFGNLGFRLVVECPDTRKPR